jgi:hypothetical protein
MRRLLPLLLASTLFAAQVSATTAIFANAPTIRIESYVDDIRAADFDRDQKLDFVVVRSVDSTTTRLSVYFGNGDGLFRDPIVSNVTPPPGASRIASNMAVADLDGNGFPDLVVAFGTFLQTFLGKGDGTFDALSPLQQTRSCTYGNLVLADVTSDGRPDIVTCGDFVLPSLGDGNFGPPISTGVSFGGQDLLVLDANGDGKRDVFVGGTSHSSLLLGSGDGTFQRDSTLPDIESEGTAAGDFDGDGRDDLTFIDGLLGDRVLMLASPTGGHGARTSMGFVASLGDSAMITVDLNGDARPDVVAGGPSHLYVWLTGPDGLSFAPAVYLSPNDARQIIAGDFDSDGKTDLLVAGQSDAQAYPPTEVALIRGVGEGTLRSERGYGLPNRLHFGRYEPAPVIGMTLSDITGDGLLDIIAATDWTINVLPGQSGGTFGPPIMTALDPNLFSPFAYFGDVNGDGAVDVIVETHNSTYECWLGSRAGTFRLRYTIPNNKDGQEAIGDFNGDGNLDLAQVGDGTPQMWPGHGDGTFGAPIVTSLVANPYTLERLRVADINADGRADVVTDRTVLLGLATGQFEPLNYSQTHVETTVADMDGDGILDLIRAEGTRAGDQETVEIRRGRGDGTFFGYGKLLTLLTAGAYAPPLVADFDGDGDLDLSSGTSVLQGDGHGWFEGYARFRGQQQMDLAEAADLDHNGSADLVLSGDATHSIDVIRTRTTTSRELPLPFTYAYGGSVQQVGRFFQMVYSEEPATWMRPGGGALLFFLDGYLTSVGELADREKTARGVLQGQHGGPQTFSVAYGGDEVYARTPANSKTIVVPRGESSMTTSLNPPSPRADQIVRVTGTVAGFGGVPPQGPVTVVIDNVLAGTGTAPLYDVAVGPFSAGTHSILLEYLGDANYLTSSQFFYFTVTMGRATMQFFVSPPEAAAVGTSVTLTAAFPHDPAIAGLVEFFADSQSLGQKAIADGKASVTATLPLGHYTFHATFTGNSQYVETPSAPIPYTITSGPPRRRASYKP